MHSMPNIAMAGHGFNTDTDGVSTMVETVRSIGCCCCIFAVTLGVSVRRSSVGHATPTSYRSDPSDDRQCALTLSLLRCALTGPRDKHPKEEIVFL